MEEIRCSFCYSTVPAMGTQVVAGAKVFICRRCTEVCMDVFAGADPEWRDLQLARLEELRTRSLSPN